MATEESDVTSNKRMKMGFVQSPPAMSTMEPAPAPAPASLMPTTKPATAPAPAPPRPTTSDAVGFECKLTDDEYNTHLEQVGENDVSKTGYVQSPPAMSTMEPAPAPAPVSSIPTTEPAPASASAPPRPTNSDEDDLERELTDDEYNAYLKQVRESDGFDVDALPPCTLLSPIQPVVIESLPACFDLKVYSQHALDEYNRRFQGELEFVKILKVMGHIVRYPQFYITLEARDMADGGNIKTYQTLVMEVAENDYYVSSFRLKPPEDERGSSNQPKEWFWKDSLC